MIDCADEVCSDTDNITCCDEDPGVLTTTTASVHMPLHKLVLHGACQERDVLNGDYDFAGVTATGAPYFQAVRGRFQFYLYYDPHCDGAVGPRWIIDTDAPSVSTLADLDADRVCDYLARVSSNDPSSPPSATWLMHCGDRWTPIELHLNAPYALVQVGACQDEGRTPITEASECSASAVFLHLGETTPTIYAGTARREGCFWDGSNELLLLAMDPHKLDANEEICGIAIPSNQALQAQMADGAAQWKPGHVVLFLFICTQFALPSTSISKQF